MQDVASKIESGLGKLLNEHLWEFLFVQGAIVFLDVVSRLISCRRQLDSRGAGLRREGWFSVLSLGPDLCLVAVTGVFVSWTISTSPDQTAGTLHLITLTSVIAMTILVAFILGTSSRRPAGLFWDKTFLVGVHLPNALGFASVLLVAALISERL